MSTKIPYYGLLLIMLLTVTGCQLTQSAFARTAGNAGAAFAAASLTLSYAHQGKVSVAYAMSAFVNYQSELSNTDQQLSTQRDAPKGRAMQQLLAIYRSAMQVVNRPCLSTSCHWHSQVAVLDQASQAFLKAGGQ